MATRSDNLPRRFAKIYTAAITDVFDQKARAMAEFTSQTEYEYQRAMAALNTYRSLFTARGAGFAEGFYTATLPIYLGLYRAVAVGHRRPRAVAR